MDDGWMEGWMDWLLCISPSLYWGYSLFLWRVGCLLVWVVPMLNYWTVLTLSLAVWSWCCGWCWHWCWWLRLGLGISTLFSFSFFSS
ncbi:hypothetical protein B0J18DRAFT_423006 [Chaetomium sp. MPI-SDFR-AT-0129]|nr:hypothetical protein B0J18DRAFT_423006 [Chaetomium sp. MPI-SDFR-AT-0129]